MPKPGTDDKFNATAFLKKIEDRWVRQSLASLSPGYVASFCTKLGTRALVASLPGAFGAADADPPPLFLNCPPCHCSLDSGTP